MTDGRSQRTFKFLLLLILLTSFFYYPLFNMDRIVSDSFKGITDFTTPDFLKETYTKILVHEHTAAAGQFPLWNPYTYAGTPYWGLATKFPVYPPYFILHLLFDKVSFIINLSLLFSIYLAAIGAFFFTRYYFKIDDKYAVIAGLVYAAGGLVFSPLWHGVLAYVYAASLIPFLLYFFVKALRERTYSATLCAGGLLALQYYSGGTQHVLYTFLLLALVVASELILRTSSKKDFLQKTTVLIIAGIICGGLAAPKILPDMEYLEHSNRNVKYFELKEFPGVLSDGFDNLQQLFIRLYHRDTHWNATEGYVGIVAFLLMLLTLKHIKRKSILAMWGVILFVLLGVTATPVYRLVQSLPGFTGTRYVWYYALLYAVPAAALSGLGASLFIERFKQVNKQQLIWMALVVLIFLNLWYVHGNLEYHDADIEELAPTIPILKYIREQPGIFRMHTLEVTGLDYNVQHLTMPNKLEALMGIDGGVWLTDLFPEYLSAVQLAPAKMYGLLNVKYVTSQSNVTIPGFTFANTFDICELCWPLKGNGPYLYENKQVMPRAYFVNTSILVLGIHYKEAGYGLMLNQFFDPTQTVIIFGGENLSAYSGQELKQFDYILLTSQLPESSIMKLSAYHSAGGMVMPNIFENEQQLSQQHIDDLLKKHNTNYTGLTEILHTRYTPNERTLDLSGLENGFVVLSEKFYLFPWIFEPDLGTGYRANGISTAYYLDRALNSTSFHYFPNSLRKGLYIFTATVLFILLLFFTWPRIFRKLS